MNSIAETKRPLCLMSGGLDSYLAVCLLKKQGLDVQAIAFESPFFSPEQARKAAKDLKIPLLVVDFSGDIINLLKNPPHGYGFCMNPCIDCHALMFKRAGDMLDKTGCHYLATGEVLNERPMSQTKKSLDVVANESGYAPLILRPLSALNLAPTQPEELGWVDRSKLLGLQGRSRKVQFALAKEFKLKSYPTPSGGCKLTEPGFCRRLKDLKAHEGIDSIRALHMLKTGRHLRFSNLLKIVVGRNREENLQLESLAEKSETLLKLASIPGPSALLPSGAGEEDIIRAAAICAAYSDASPSTSVTISACSDGRTRRFAVNPAPHNEFKQLLI